MPAKRNTKSTKRVAPTVTLICWSATEGKQHAGWLQQRGFKVKLEVESRGGPAILRRLRENSPDALIIDLGRLPMQGRDVGLAIRTGKQTRHVPLVFVDGEPSKVERVRQTLPDAVYTSWAGVAAALKRAIAKPNPNPVVPSSNLAGYSGTPLPNKLGIKPNVSMVLLEEPEGFVEIVEPLPSGVEITRCLTPATGVAIWFVRSATALASRIDSVAGQVKAAKSCRLWIAWAKRTSRLASDVNENLVRTAALAAGLVDYKVAAIDADWSGLLFAPRKEVHT
jgi:CheY-like chemotaxis protein